MTSIQQSTERELRCVKELRFRTEGNVVHVGSFPRPCCEHLHRTETGLWKLYLYRWSLVRRRVRATPARPLLDFPSISGGRPG